MTVCHCWWCGPASSSRWDSVRPDRGAVWAVLPASCLHDCWSRKLVIQFCGGPFVPVHSSKCKRVCVSMLACYFTSFHYIMRKWGCLFVFIQGFIRLIGLVYPPINFKSIQTQLILALTYLHVWKVESTAVPSRLPYSFWKCSYFYYSWGLFDLKQKQLCPWIGQHHNTSLDSVLYPYVLTFPFPFHPFS